MPQTHTAVLKLEKETKGTRKYQEVEVPGKPPVIGTLYVQKWAAGTSDVIKVTLELQ